MNRAQFIKYFGFGLCSLLMDPLDFFPSFAQAQLPVLILIELKGGNDGLNTVIPFTDPAYYQLRPRLAMNRNKTLHLSPELGMHPSLQPLWNAWESKDLAWILGVGYPKPNRSHFRSIEIWETGSDADAYLTEGWLAPKLLAWPERKGTLLDGLYYRGDPGPLASQRLRALSAHQTGLKESSTILPPNHVPQSLQHILRVQRTVQVAEKDLKKYYSQTPDLQKYFPNSVFGRELADMSQLILSKAPIPVYRISLGSFDTHRQQAGTHARLLQQLAEGLSAFRRLMIIKGEWQRVLLMSYSEFGRRPQENASGGTDHGTAAPHFLLGGRVQGGLYGRQPLLSQLVDQDLSYSVDFRRIYQSVASGWWGLSAKTSGSAISPLKIFR